jgi:hypothetical protein
MQFMHMKRIISISIAVLAASFAGGCSKSPRIAVSPDAARGTNVTTVTNDGHTMFLGKTVLNTNASAGVRSSP